MTSPGAWVRSGQRPARSPDDELFRKFQGILNKINRRNFQTLSEQALGLHVSTEERLLGCVERLHKAAIFAGLKFQGPNFTTVYANLAKALSPIKATHRDEEKATNFRRVLLTKCQLKFEDRTEVEEWKRVLLSANITDSKKRELEVKLARAHRVYRANILFIAELFKVKMLSETILHECIVRLLHSTSDAEALECAAVLMTAVGKDIDHAQAKARIDGYMDRIADIISRGRIPPRVRFMLQDVVELRENHWQPRRLWQERLTSVSGDG